MTVGSQGREESGVTDSPFLYRVVNKFWNFLGRVAHAFNQAVRRQRQADLCEFKVVVTHAFSPSVQDVESGGSLSSRPACSTKRVPGQLGLHRETLP